MADAQPIEPAPAGDTPQKFTFASPAHWRLSGDAGSLSLDQAVEFCITVGLTVSFIEPGAYRIAGKMERIQKVAEWINAYRPAPISFAIERPPASLNLRFEVRPDRPPPRVAEVHGMHQPERPVARAIDAGLDVVAIGIKHYRMSGPTRCHVAWMAGLFEVSTERALQIMQLTPAQAAAEDAASPLPPINVVLPTRQTTSTISRDGYGSISQIVQLEKSV